MSDSKTKEFQWTDNLVKTFISTRSGVMDQFREGKRAHKTIYQDIVTVLELDGLQTAEQLRKKWNNLCKRYKSMKNPSTGTGKPTPWNLYEAMDQAIGQTHAIVPPQLISSCEGTIAKPAPVEESPKSSPKKKRAKCSTQSSETTALLKQIANSDSKLLEQQDVMIETMQQLVKILAQRET